MKSLNRVAVITIILVLAFTSLAAAPAANGRSIFAGGWKGTDSSDGSGISVAITAFNRISFTDKAFPACGGGEVVGKGQGTQVGSTLIAGLKLKCKSSGVVVDGNYTLSFTANRASETLVDSNGNVYALVARTGCNGR